jgi:hypothetical protein
MFWCEQGLPILKVQGTLNVVETWHNSIRLLNNMFWTVQLQHQSQVINGRCMVDLAKKPNLHMWIEEYSKNKEEYNQIAEE